MAKQSYILLNEATAAAFNKQVDEQVDIDEQYAKALLDAGKIKLAGSDTKEDKKAATRADKTDKTATKTK